MWDGAASAGGGAPGYDRGEGRRRWRHLDLGVVRSFIEAEAPRVRCPEHGVVVAWVPWARHKEVTLPLAPSATRRPTTADWTLPSRIVPGW